MMDLINFLQSWYVKNCDGVWEHSNGIEIVTLDNPGWKVIVEGASDRKEKDFKVERNDNDWVAFSSTKTQFSGYGGANNLKEILGYAIDWLNE